MGISQTFYVGPMVCCEPYPIEIERTTTVCPNGCKYSDGKFCCYCAAERETRKEKVAGTAPDSWDVRELLGEVFMEAGPDSKSEYVYWIPNVRWDGEPEMRLGRNDELLPVGFDGVYIDEKMAAFWKRFDEELKLLKQEYRGKVRVFWGVTSWCSC